MEVAQAGEENEQRGNNLIANELCQLLTRKDAAGNDDNFDGVYTEIVTGIATAQNHFNTLASSQTVVATQVDEQRKSVSGVSLEDVYKRQGYHRRRAGEPASCADDIDSDGHYRHPGFRLTQLG